MKETIDYTNRLLVLEKLAEELPEQTMTTLLENTFKC